MTLQKERHSSIQHFMPTILEKKHYVTGIVFAFKHCNILHMGAVCTSAENTVHLCRFNTRQVQHDYTYVHVQQSATSSVDFCLMININWTALTWGKSKGRGGETFERRVLRSFKGMLLNIQHLVIHEGHILGQNWIHQSWVKVCFTILDMLL